MNKNNSLAYFLFVIGLFFCLISPNFLTEGMFMDGTYYASISHKMATGQCSFWCPKFDNFLHTEFYEHPPLAFLTQSWFIKLFGDNFYWDKIYSIFTCLITGFIIFLIWKKITGDSKSAWMPLLFWIVTPLTIWGATNNMLENTMTIFITLSVYLCLFENKPYIFSALAGICIFLAFMVKGPTALFPLAFPIIQFFFQKGKSFWKYVLQAFTMAATSVAFFFAMLLISKDSVHFFESYYIEQIHESFTSEPTVNCRLYIIWRWFCEIIVGLSIIIVSFLIRHKGQSFKKIASIKASISNDQEKRKTLTKSIKFLLLGLCGVIPIMISLKQRSFYIIPTLPFFAISMALIFRSVFKEPNSSKLKYIVSGFIIVAAITLNIVFFGRVSRDKEMLHDIHAFEKVIPEKEMILIPRSLAMSYSLHGYYARYFDSTLTTKDENNEYLILPKDETYNAGNWKSKYKKADIKTEKFNLYINESNKSTNEN